VCFFVLHLEPGEAWLPPEPLTKEKLGHVDSQGNTALHVAVSHVQIETTRVLVTAGAPTDYVDAENRTPGDIAATKGSPELAKLVAYKASINDMAGAGRTPEVEKMIAQGVDPNRRDREGRTPLMAACLCKHELTVGTLVDHKCNVNAKDKSGFDALTWLLDPKKGEDAATLKISRFGRKAQLHVAGRQYPLSYPLLKFGCASEVCWFECAG